MNLKTFKRSFVSLLMALVMLTTCVSAATTDYTASIMRLEKAIGFYSVTNSIGNSVTVRDGGRIYTGYQVKTGLGYAWISLDDDTGLEHPSHHHQRRQQAGSVGGKWRNFLRHFRSLERR